MALALPWPAAAVAEPPGGSPAVAAVLACRSIKNRANQLACFREASDQLAAERSPDGVASASPPPPETPRAFGLRPPPAARAVRPRAVRSVTVKFGGMNDPGDGRVVFYFDDGSAWREIEPDPVAGALIAGQTVTLEKGLLGSYFLDIPGRASVKVARLRGR
jgi:hypothetical protein